MTYQTFQKAEFFPKTNADTLKITAPNGKETLRPVFEKQPVTFTYDVHGYESVTAAGEECSTPAAKWHAHLPLL